MTSLVIADTGPINYLILIRHIDVLPQLFKTVILPDVVREELTRQRTPAAVREWIEHAPAWVQVHSVHSAIHGAGEQRIDAGEEAAILLALELGADMLLTDDRRGVVVARRRGLTVTGTLGVLKEASRLGLLDLAVAFDRLKQTNFRNSQELLDQLLVDDETGSSR